MRLRGFYIIAIVAVCVAIAGVGCRKQNQVLTSGGIIQFSVDTLKFDTVFTAEGSFTTGLLIYNPQNEAVVVSSVRMQNGTTSYFHLNVDGRPGKDAVNIKIAAHDSAYVFATVNINPDTVNSPFFIIDNLVATMNGKDFTVPFTAYGQNAHYVIGDSLFVNTTWLTDKPYDVIGNLVVGPGTTLTIPPKCRVYMHQGAQIVVYGTLNIGAAGGTDTVVFQGDRLDRAYFGYIGYPGEWGGLWFVPGGVGNINHTILKNCGGGAGYYAYSIIPAAVRADTAAVVNISHSIIKNSISVGLLGFQGTFNATNCLVNTTGGQALAVTLGGSDSFVNCTFANYGTGQVTHSNAGTVAILDWYSPDNKNYYYGDLNVVMRNCIVYGSLDSEIVCDTSGSPAGVHARLLMDNCLLKMGSVREPFIQFTAGCIFGAADSLFKDPANGDFRLNAISPAIDKGTNVPGIGTLDLDNNPRVIRAIDIGCYEFQ